MNKLLEPYGAIVDFLGESVKVRMWKSYDPDKSEQGSSGNSANGQISEDLLAQSYLIFLFIILKPSSIWNMIMS